jgi:hypothetical protein
VIGYRIILDTETGNKKSLKIPKGGNQNPYIEEEQANNGHKKKYKRTNNDLQNIHINIKIA